MKRIAVCALLSLVLLPAVCRGQAATVFTIDTVVGGAVYDNLPATATPLSFPSGMFIDRGGVIWLADSGNQVIRRIDRTAGVMRVAVGGGTIVEDGAPVPATSVRLDRPSHITADAAGNIYFTDSGQNRVRKVTPDGLVSTVVGTGEAGFAGDGGPARLAKLNDPTGLALDPAGNLYIAERRGCRIRRVTSAGVISTFAGTGRCGLGFAGDGGPALNAGFVIPNGLAMDSRGNLYVADFSTIRRIDAATGLITTAVGIPPVLGPGCSPNVGQPVPARNACVHFVHSLQFDQEGNLYFTHNGGAGKFTVNAETVIGIPGPFQSTGLALTGSGTLLLASSIESRMIEISPSGGPQISIAGTDEPFDGLGRLAVLGAPRGVSVDSAGNVYISDRIRRKIRRYDPVTRQVSTVVGGGTTMLADGVLAGASLLPNDIEGLHVDARGNLLFDQTVTLWKVDAQTGRISRLAGSTGTGSTGDGGPALQANFTPISAIVTDAAGNIYVAEEATHRVRRIDAVTGIITTIAGNGTPGNSGDGGPATAASVGGPKGLAFDRQGQLLIAYEDGTGGSIRRVNLTSGVITTLQARYRLGDPLGTFRGIQRGLAVDRDGNIFYLTGGTLVGQIRASDSLVVFVAGSTSEGFFGDGGVASLARLSLGSGSLAPDSSGNIYVADEQNSRVRKLSLTVVLPEMAISPGTLFFTQQQGSTLLTGQQLTISSANNLPFNWTLETSTSAGGAWLNASRTSGSAPATVLITVDAARLGAGTYRGTVTVRATGTSNSPQTVEVVLTVTGATGSVLGLSQQYLNFQGVQGGANPAAQTLSITNAGSGTLSWSATAETSNGGSWLRVSPALGTAPSTLAVSTDITGLAQGVYQGRVVLRNLVANETRTISVVLTVTRQQPILLPTQTGFLFVGVEGSLVIGPQSFAMQNPGQGRMDWQVAVNLPGGGDWLRVSPLAGSTEAGMAQPPQVTLQIDPSRLRAGVSVALLTLVAQGALNSPQTAIVLVNMLPRGSPPVGTINPLGLIFTSPAGATGTLSQGIIIASTGGQALQFLARARTQAGGNWLTVTPEQGVLLSSAESASLTVQSSPAGLAAGVYFGTIALSFGTGVTQEVAIALVVAPITVSASSTLNLEHGALNFSAACTPRRLVVVETKLGNRFSLDVGWPVPLLAQAVDDCGTAVTAATVTASFTGGDPPVAFQNLRNGQYAATWVPATRGSVGVTVRAVSAGLDDGVVQFAGTLGTSSTLPLLFRDGWVNAASFDRFRPLAPGMIFSLFGSNLAEGRNFASEVPLPRTLGNLRVTMGGIDAPLFYTDGGQVNAQVPFELAAAQSASLVVTGRGAAGAPGTVTLVAAQPGIFTLSQSGTGQGVVLDAQNRVVDSANPVAAGEVVVIYATGLGLTDPPVATGAATPGTPLSRVVTPVTVTIGGQSAAVEFAGLAPGFVGLYQVNARVPAGVAAGSAVPLVLTQNGVAGNTVTIAVR